MNKVKEIDLHSEIMNIKDNYYGSDCMRLTQCDPEMAYKLGHRDARHKAAEISNKYDTLVDLTNELAEALESIIEYHDSTDGRFMVVIEDGREALAKIQEYNDGK